MRYLLVAFAVASGIASAHAQPDLTRGPQTCGDVHDAATARIIGCPFPQEQPASPVSRSAEPDLTRGPQGCGEVHDPATARVLGCPVPQPPPQPRQVVPPVAQSNQSTPLRCLKLDGGYTPNCDGSEIAPCAALRAIVSIDTCTLAVKKQRDEIDAAERKEAASPEQQARRNQYFQTPEGRLLQSSTNFYGQRDIFLCVAMHENDVDVLEICKVDPKSNYAAGAVDYIAKIRPAVPRGPGMTIGGRAAYATPWVNAHCTPRVAGYTCTWKGIVLEYQ